MDGWLLTRKGVDLEDGGCHWAVREGGFSSQVHDHIYTCLQVRSRFLSTWVNESSISPYSKLGCETCLHVLARTFLHGSAVLAGAVLDGPWKFHSRMNAQILHGKGKSSWCVSLIGLWGGDNVEVASMFLVFCSRFQGFGPDT